MPAEREMPKQLRVAMTGAGLCLAVWLPEGTPNTAEFVRKDVAEAEAQRLREDVAALRAAVALHAQTLDDRALGHPDHVKRDRDSIDNDLYSAVRARDPRWWDREVPGLAACSEGDNDEA